MSNVSRLIHTCDMTHPYVWHVLKSIWIWRLTYVCKYGVANWLVQHESSIPLTWLILTCHMTHSYVWHDQMSVYLWTDFDSRVDWFIRAHFVPGLCSYLSESKMPTESPRAHDQYEKSSLKISLLQPIADRVAQNLEIIFTFFSTNQNSAHGIYN